MSRGKRELKRRRKQYIENIMYLLVIRASIPNVKLPNDPWPDIPVADIVRAIKIWEITYKTSVPLMQYCEQALGTPKKLA